MAGLRSLVARLRRRNVRPARVDSLATVLEAAAETGATVIVPGLAAWLGWTPPEPDDSIDSYEAYIEGISRKAAVR